MRGTARSTTSASARMLSTRKGGTDCKVKTNFAGASTLNIPPLLTVPDGLEY